MVPAFRPYFDRRIHLLQRNFSLICVFNVCAFPLSGACLGIFRIAQKHKLLRRLALRRWKGADGSRRGQQQQRDSR